MVKMPFFLIIEDIFRGWYSGEEPGGFRGGLELTTLIRLLADNGSALKPQAAVM